MAVYLGNAFSLNMLQPELGLNRVEIEPSRADAVPSDAQSIINHPDTAALVSNRLGRLVVENRATVHLSPGDVLYVAQFIGERLEEGARELPPYVPIIFYKVTLI